MMKTKTIKLVVFCVMLVFSLTMLFPYFWMLSTSLKMDTEVFKFPIEWIPANPVWENYVEVWTRIPFPRYFLNTFWVTALAVVLQLIACTTAAYAFAKLEFKFKNVIFIMFLSTMMIPWHSTMIPQFSVVARMGLYDSHWALIALRIFSAFGIFLLRQFFMGIPLEVSEAAKIDGCNEFQIYSKMILPLSGPAIATLCIFTFMNTWNDYLAPLIYLQTPEKLTIQLGLAEFVTTRTMEYSIIMAGTVCALMPIILVYLFAEKYITQGVAFSGLKS